MEHKLFKTIHDILSENRFSLTSEKECQEEIERLLLFHEIKFEREFVLGPEGRPDFFIPEIGLVIEVKIKGRPMDIYRQCKGYCKDKRTKSLILLTNKTIGLPKQIEEKPSFLIKMGRSWL